MRDFESAFDLTWQHLRYGVSYQTIVLACGSQMGKSDAVLDVIGQMLDERPSPVLYVGPSQSFVEREIEPRVMALLNGSRRLSERVARGKRLHKHRKMVGGVPLALAWAGSASQVAGMAAKLSLIDELDRVAADVEGEGDPFSLLEARGFSFVDRVRSAISTPLKGIVDIEVDPVSGLELWRRMSSEDVESPIWRLWQAGTRHHFTWPCPCCGEHFVPRFKQLRWEGWPEIVSAVQTKRTAFVECPRCGGVIEEEHKAEMNRRGHFVAPGQSIDPETDTVTGPLPETTTLSYWVSGLCSPTVTFGDRAASYVEAKASGEQSRLQAVVNTGFGELFAPGSGDVPEWEEVKALARPYPRGAMPKGAKVLTLAVDVQKNRLVYTIRAWGYAGTSWLVDFGELWGATTEAKVWADLAQLLTRPIDGHVIKRAFIDSGYRPGKPVNLPINRIYEFCRRFPRHAFPTKGQATQKTPIKFTKIEVQATGSTKRYGLDLVWVDTDWSKSWVHERIRWDEDQPGAWFIPLGEADDTEHDKALTAYCKQIVSEARVRKPNGLPIWVRKSRDNHYLDCEGLQAALAHSLNVHLIAADPTSEAPPPVKPTASAKPKAVTAEKKPAATMAAPADQRTQRRAKLAELRQRIYGGG